MTSRRKSESRPTGSGGLTSAPGRRGSARPSRSTKKTSQQTPGAAGRTRSSSSASSIAEILGGREPGSMTLIVAEKPSVARDIARVLGRDGDKLKTHESYLCGQSHVVTWAIGHLLELCEPEDYDSAWRRWRLEHLPIIPQSFRLRPITRTRSHLLAVLALLRSPAFGQVVNACDAGREGELIFRHLIQQAGVELPVRRLWISAMTDEAIRDGLAALGDGRDYERLEAAARCRSESDWLVGINATRGMTTRCGVLLSVGRVQTPTLAVLVQREQAIAAFVAERYWEVEALFSSGPGTYRGRWFDPQTGVERLDDQTRAQDIARQVAGREGVVEEVVRKRRNQLPPMLHDLTQLQRDMNRRHGFSASRTLRLAQDLYEKYKVITYPRTDSRYLSGRNIPTLRPILQAVGSVFPDLLALSVDLLGGGERLPITGRVVNDARVRDHHAIIPTVKAAAGSRLKGDHLKVFEAVARRFAAVFLPPAVIENTAVTTAVSGERFRSRGRVVLERGWLAAEPTGWAGQEEDEEDLPAGLVEGLPVRAEVAEPLEKETKPPPRFTEASLLQVMDTAGKLVDDEELQEAMKDRGIGTPATRAAIIERLIEVGYVERDRKALVATPKGVELISAIPTRDLVSPALTGLWESRLREVERGSLDRAVFMADIARFVERLVEEVRGLEAGDARTRMRRSVGSCPRCGTEVAEGPRAYFCTSRDCKFYLWKTVAGRRLKPEEAAVLLKTGETLLLRGFRSKRGGRFSAYLVLQEDQLSFRFPERKTTPARRKAEA